MLTQTDIEIKNKIKQNLIKARDLVEQILDTTLSEKSHYFLEYDVWECWAKLNDAIKEISNTK